MLLRQFNQTGIDRFRAFIASLRTNKMQQPPIELLLDDAATEIITPHTESEDAEFGNRLAAAEYLNKLLGSVRLADAFSNVGLWSWLALRFYDELMPFDKEGVPESHLRQLGVDEARFIPSENYRDRHRHLLRHPLQVYRTVRGDADRAMCFLVQPVYRPGDFIEQIASRQMYTWYEEMLATLSTLVVDFGTRTMKDNASSRARRLDDVLQQFDCTWDLGFIAKDLLIPMLPKEFREFGRRQRKKKPNDTGAEMSENATLSPR